MAEQWMTVREAVAQTGVPERTIYRWIKEAKIMSRTVGGRIYVEGSNANRQASVSAQAQAQAQARARESSTVQLKILIRDLYGNAVLFNRRTDPLWRDLEDRVREVLK